MPPTPVATPVAAASTCRGCCVVWASRARRGSQSAAGIGDEYVDLLEAEGIHPLTYPIDGLTRESFAVFDEARMLQYRIVVDGPTIDDPDAMREAIIDAAAAGADVVVLSGGIAPGLPDRFYADLVDAIAATHGVTTVVDSAGPPLAEVMTQRSHAGQAVASRARLDGRLGARRPARDRPRRPTGPGPRQRQCVGGVARRRGCDVGASATSSRSGSAHRRSIG